MIFSDSCLIQQQIFLIDKGFHSFEATMVGSKSSSYLAKKFRNTQLLLNSKAKQTIYSALTRTPRLIKTSFTESSSGKKTAQSTNTDFSPRPSTQLAGVVVGVSTPKVSPSNTGSLMVFTPAPMKGRKKKSMVVCPLSSRARRTTLYRS